MYIYIYREKERETEIYSEKQNQRETERDTDKYIYNCFLLLVLIGFLAAGIPTILGIEMVVMSPVYLCFYISVSVSVCLHLELCLSVSWPMCLFFPSNSLCPPPPPPPSAHLVSSLQTHKSSDRKFPTRARL